MRSAAALIAIACCLVSGCGGGSRGSGRTATVVEAPRRAPQGLRVGVVGDLTVRVPGAVVEHGRLRTLLDSSLVVVDGSARASAGVPGAAAAHPATHFALVGASARTQRLANLAGFVIRRDQAARLGGAVAGIVVSEERSAEGRVAWVGPVDHALVAQFVRGVHDVAPGTVVLRAWSRVVPASCKEAALGAIARGAIVVMAPRGRCADAAIAGAHQQNHPGLQLSDFELPDVVADQAVRDAVAGVYHGREDLVYGAASGAVAVRALDPRISAAAAVRARRAAQQLASGLRPSG
jgi:hypothetical protein